MKHITQRNNPTIQHLLTCVWQLDPNSWAIVTDGSYDEFDDAEAIDSLNDLLDSFEE